MPGPHAEQAEALAAEKVPGAHGWHVAAEIADVAAEKVPAAQLVQAASDEPPAEAA